jgi:hypothetical protein
MSRGLLICVLCLTSAAGCAHTPAARCWVADAQGAQVISTKPLHQSKHWSHYRIAPDELFLEFQYDPLTSAVTVRTVQSPHYPWTISERVLDSAVVRMTGAPSKGESSIGTPKLTIMCQEGD